MWDYLKLRLTSSDGVCRCVGGIGRWTTRCRMSVCMCVHPGTTNELESDFSEWLEQAQNFLQQENIISNLSSAAFLTSLHTFSPCHCFHTYPLLNKACKVDFHCSHWSDTISHHCDMLEIQSGSCVWSRGPTLSPPAHICWGTDVHVEALHFSEAQCRLRPLSLYNWNTRIWIRILNHFGKFQSLFLKYLTDLFPSKWPKP